MGIHIPDAEPEQCLAIDEVEDLVIRRYSGLRQLSHSAIKEVLAQMGLHLGMEIPNWPPENIEELAKRLDEPLLRIKIRCAIAFTAAASAANPRTARRCSRTSPRR